MSQGRLIDLRLFLEGIEVDVISATVTAGIAQPCSAQIEIPATDAAHELEARTLVHLFFQETHYEGDVPTNTVDYGDPTKWKLLFAGEMVNISFVKSGDTRAVYLQCQDFSSYWQAAQLYWGTGATSANTYKKTIFSGATRLATGKKQLSGGNALANLISAQPTSNPTLSGVLGGIVSLLEASTGVYDDTKGAKSYRGVNDFMSQAEIRLHLTRMIGAAPDDDTSETFLNSGDMRTYFQRLSAATKSTASFMDLTETFLGKIYHQWCSVAAPPFRKDGLVVVSQSFPEPIKIAGGAKVQAEYKKALAARAAIEARLNYTITNGFKQGADGVGSATTADRALVGPVLGGQGPDNTLAIANLEHVTFNLTPAITAVISPGATDTTLRTARQLELDAIGIEVQSQTKDPKQQTKIGDTTQGLTKFGLASRQVDIIVTPVDVTESNGTTQDQTKAFLNHTTARLKAARQLYDDGIELMRKGSGVPSRVERKTVKATSRLNAFLFTPDLFMVPPPACNVMFPDQYMSVQFSRSWLQETTRMWLFGQPLASQGQTGETVTGYFSPNSDILAGPNAKDSSDAAGKGLSFLMKHEIYSGPIPALKSLGDMTVFQKLHQQVEKQSAKAGYNDSVGFDVAGQARYSPQEHMQRAVNYLFYAERYGGRTMSVNAKFSPQLIVGLPMLLLDPVEGGVTRITRDNEVMPDTATPGVHYVGTVAQIEHTLTNRGGASTQLQMTKCRRHNEGLELLMTKDGTVDADTGIASIDKRMTLVLKKTLRKDKYAGYDKKGTTFVGTLDAGAGPIQPVANTLSSTALTNNRFLDPDTYIAMVGGPALKHGTDGAALTSGTGTTTVTDQVVSGAKTRTTIKTYGNKTYKVVVTERQYDPFGKDASAQVSSDLGGNAGQLVPDGFVAGPTAGTAATIGGIRVNTPPEVVYDVAVYVDTKHDVLKPLMFTFEGTTTPPWFASIYLPMNIGTRYYDPMLGCKSVIDAGVFTPPAKKPTGDAPYSVDFVVGGSGTATTTLSIPQDLADESFSTQQAANKLAEAWTGLKRAGANLEKYTELYNARAYASMLDIMGNNSPYLNVNGFMNPGYPSTNGFHGNAFGAMDASKGGGLSNFYGDPLEETGSVPLMARFGKKTLVTPPTRKVAAASDPRPGRYQRVIDYLAELYKLRISNGNGG